MRALHPPPPSAAFQDIRNQREKVAARKAELLFELGPLLNKVPKSVAQGSIQAVHHWQSVRKACAKVAANKAASVRQLEDAIAEMGRFE